MYVRPAKTQVSLCIDPLDKTSFLDSPESKEGAYCTISEGSEQNVLLQSTVYPTLDSPAIEEMYRMSLRRQMFYKNIDLLLQSNSLQTVEEEFHDDKPNKESSEMPVSSNQQNGYQSVSTQQGDKVLLTQPKKFTLDAGSGGSPETKQQSEETNVSRSPIYKPNKIVDHDSPAVSESGAGNHSQERLIRPGTPYTEIDESKVGFNRKKIKKTSIYTERKKKRRAMPLKFQFPSATETTADVNNNNSNTASFLPFSPIPRDGKENLAYGTAFAEENYKACSQHGDVVRALPVSPAAYAITSTPGPASMSMNAPLCQTITEENIFNFSEGNMCRICHEGDEEEELVSPCDCTGTMGMLHISCLEQWLGSSKTTKCEICQFQFSVLKKPQSIKWYLKEPSLTVERKLMIRDVILIVCLGLFVLIGSIVCIVYSKKLQMANQHVGASLLIVFPTAGIILYAGFLIFAIYKIRQRFKAWIKEHHVIQITQGSPKQNTSNKIFRRFPYPQSKKKQHPATTSVLSHLDPFLARFSLESYKAAMYNPILPVIPENCGLEGIEVNMNSSSVISLDDEEDSHVRYYQPPEPGSTSILYNETGKLLRETGV